jgi:hypothetical protein
MLSTLVELLEEKGIIKEQEWENMEIPQREQRLDTNCSNRYSSTT